MSDDGGPFFPGPENAHPENPEPGVRGRGASLRERFAVALAGNPNFRTVVSEAVLAAAQKDATAEAIEQRVADLTFTVAQFYTDEALARRRGEGAKSDDEVKQ